MTVRIDRELRNRLAATARRRASTPSDLVRDALETWLGAHETRGGATPYEALADLIGSVRGGDPKRSTRGSRAIATDVRRRRDRNR